MASLSELWKPLLGLENCCCAGKKEVEKVVHIPNSAGTAEVLPSLQQVDVRQQPVVLPGGKVTPAADAQALGGGGIAAPLSPPSPLAKENGMVVPPPHAPSPQPSDLDDQDVATPAAPAAAQKPMAEGYVSAKQADDEDRVGIAPPGRRPPEKVPEQTVFPPQPPGPGVDDLPRGLPACTRPAPNEQAQQAQQKAALQRMVNTFAHDAVRGRPCKFINSSLECRPTEYRLDSSLQYLLIFSSSDHSNVEVQCNVGRIQDIHTYAEDGPNCFHPQIISNIGNAEDLENLMMMTYLDRRGEPCSFCLVEANPESRDVFLQSMRVLGIYAQQFVQQVPRPF